MTQEEKKLLLIDLCARQPYGVKVRNVKNNFDINNFNHNVEEIKVLIEEYDIKPYLRPLSSMTEEEEEDFKQIIEIELKYLESELVGHTVESAASSTFEIDFYNSHHFDYRGLIEKGLALEAPKGMYEIQD